MAKGGRHVNREFKPWDNLLRVVGLGAGALYFNGSRADTASE